MFLGSWNIRETHQGGRISKVATEVFQLFECWWDLLWGTVVIGALNYLSIIVVKVVLLWLKWVGVLRDLFSMGVDSDS